MAFRVPVLESFSWQKQVLGVITDLPVTPTKGDRYIVSGSATGDLASYLSQIAWYDGSEWKYDNPSAGWTTTQVVDSTSISFIYFTGTSWEQFGADLIKVDTQNFNTQLPTSVSNLQELLDWMDENIGGPGPIGTPSDGYFTDGLLDWTASVKIVDALDDVNEILKDLAPAKPESLAGSSLISNRSFHTAKLSANLSDDWYQDGQTAGSTISTLIDDATITLSTFDSTSAFYPGDEGTLATYHLRGAGTLAKVCKLNISANFVEPTPPASRPASQDLTAWDYKETETYQCADCDTPVDGVITNSNDILAVTSVSTYNNFSKWQKMNAYAQANALEAGFHEIQMIHNVRGTDRSTNIFKFFRDNDANVLAFSQIPLITENSPQYSYISGVKYYAANSIFNFTFTGTNVYRNVYHATQVSTYSCTGVSGTTTWNPSTTPNFDDSATVSGTVTINASSTYNLDGRMSATFYHPFKSSVTQQSASEGRLINTYGNVSTVLLDSWVDENYRLPTTFNTDTIPGTIIGQWTSSNSLGSNDALIYQQRLQYGNLDLSSKLPSGNPNYSTKTGDQVYMRAFNIGTAKSSMTLTLPNLTDTDVSAVGSGTINVEIKLPTQTGWCDIGSGFNANTFNVGQPVDGQGCKVGSASGNVWTLTFGEKSTTNSGGIVFVRITFRSSSAKYIGANMVAAA